MEQGDLIREARADLEAALKKIDEARAVEPNYQRDNAFWWVTYELRRQREKLLDLLRGY